MKLDLIKFPLDANKLPRTPFRRTAAWYETALMQQFARRVQDGVPAGLCELGRATNSNASSASLQAVRPSLQYRHGADETMDRCRYSLARMQGIETFIDRHINDLEMRMVEEYDLDQSRKLGDRLDSEHSMGGDIIELFRAHMTLRAELARGRSINWHIDSAAADPNYWYDRLIGRRNSLNITCARDMTRREGGYQFKYRMCRLIDQYSTIWLATDIARAIDYLYKRGLNKSGCFVKAYTALLQYYPHIGSTNSTWVNKPNKDLPIIAIGLGDYVWRNSLRFELPTAERRVALRRFLNACFDFNNTPITLEEKMEGVHIPTHAKPYPPSVVREVVQRAPLLEIVERGRKHPIFWY